MSEIIGTIQREGEKLSFSTNQVVLLMEEEVVWFLESGSVNLFAIERMGNEPKGPRHFIAGFEAPALLFGFKARASVTHDMAAVTESPCSMRKVSLSSLKQDLAKDPVYLDRWINSLSGYTQSATSSQAEIFLVPGDEKEMAKGQAFMMKRAAYPEEKSRVYWLNVLKGEVAFLGRPSLCISAHNSPFPLAYDGWGRMIGEGRIQSCGAVEKKEEGLLFFHEIFLDYCLSRMTEESKEEKIRSDKRQLHEGEFLEKSISEMVGVLNPSSDIREKKNALFEACHILGSFMGITFKMPEEVEEDKDPKLVLLEISSFSEVPFREVLLKGKWWKTDAGPLLAFCGKEQRPVALIPKGNGHYDLIEPLSQQRKAVDNALAEELNFYAYSFSPPFPEDLQSGRQMLQFVWKHNKQDFLPLLSYSLIAAVISLFPPFAIAQLFNRFVPDSQVSVILQIFLALILAACASSLFLYFRSLAVFRLEGLAANQVQLGLWDRLLKLSPRFFRKETSGNLIMRVVSIEKMRGILSGSGARAVFSGIFSLFYIAMMLIYAPVLALISCGILGVSFLTTLGLAYLYGKKQMFLYELQGKINAYIIQIISSVAKLRTAGAEKYAYAHWGLDFAKFKKVDLSAVKIQNIISVMNMLLPFILYFFIFSFLISDPAALSMGNFIAFNAAFVSFYLAMTDFNNILLELTPIFPLWKRVKVILDEQPEKQIKNERPGTLTGRIEAKELFYQYEPNAPLVLNNLSIEIKPKEFVGIVGPSGCGKSTLLRMLLGFDRPHGGAVYYDGKDLSSLHMNEVRKQIGVVLQEEGIIAGSIYDNLVCGRIFSAEQIERALAISGFAEDLEDFPMGIHTYLSMGGSTLSGGQRQRLLIARALAPNPCILFLDEATSALDNKNQEIIIESLNSLDVTRIVIAHRLSTLTHADTIYVMDKGVFIQSGTFHELASMPGMFSEMLKRQTL